MGVNPCGSVKFANAIVPNTRVAPSEYCPETTPLLAIWTPVNSPPPLPLLATELTPNGRPDRLDPVKLSAMLRLAAPFGRLLTEIVPLPETSWPLRSEERRVGKECK